MLIRKKQQPAEFPANSIHGAYTESNSDTYTCNHINEVSVYETGSNENGSYIKYGNGDMIISQHYEVSLSSTGAWGSLYGYSITNLKDYPVPFVGDLPSFVATFDAITANAWVCSKQESGVSSLTKPCALQLIRPTQNTPTGYLNIIAKGRWK